MPAPDLPAPPEAIVTLETRDGRYIARWLCTPERLDDLALGWLFSEGLIDSTAEITELTVDDIRVRARMADSARIRAYAYAERRGPGPAFPVPDDLAPRGALRRRSAVAEHPLDLTSLAGQFTALFDAARLKERHGGGVHTGGHVIGDRLIDVAEDVSRSAVVDKLVGRGLRNGWIGLETAGTSLFLLSGRISATIALKLARAGVSGAATISVPTSLAVSIAEQAGVLIVGRARRESPLIYGTF
jgi:FdhD protein